jgi:hypothetical protein
MVTIRTARMRVLGTDHLQSLSSSLAITLSRGGFTPSSFAAAWVLTPPAIGCDLASRTTGLAPSEDSIFCSTIDHLPGLRLIPPAGLAPTPASTTASPPRQPSPEPRTSPAASRPVSAPVAEAASFIKPEVVAGGDDGEEPELEGAAAGRNGGKSPAAPPKKVAQAL